VKWNSYFDELPHIYGIAAILGLCVKVDDRLCELCGVVIRPESIGSFSRGVDEYLSYQFETEDDFHIIQWWKNHSSKFPVLARIGKDILVILTSTITSKSAFSAGRRVVDEKRSHFAPQSIEMC
ncbi:putative AC9 transposase, partial [Bienertia sinuspersici]